MEDKLINIVNLFFQKLDIVVYELLPKLFPVLDDTLYYDTESEQTLSKKENHKGVLM